MNQPFRPMRLPTRCTVIHVLVLGTSLASCAGKGNISSQADANTSDDPGSAGSGSAGSGSAGSGSAGSGSAGSGSAGSGSAACTGAVFTVTPAGPINFGVVPKASGGSMRITARNTGDVAGTLDWTFTRNDYDTFSIRTTGFLAQPITSVNLAAGASATELLYCVPGAGSPPVGRQGELTFTSSSKLCGPLPPTISIICSPP
jgi:hypothetical protein